MTPYTVFVTARQTLDVRLRSAVRVSGVVLRPNGNPAAGAVLRSNRKSWEIEPNVEEVIPVGDDGRFSFRVLVNSAKGLTLTATAEEMKAETTFDATAPRTDVELKLR